MGDAKRKPAVCVLPWIGWWPGWIKGSEYAHALGLLTDEELQRCREHYARTKEPTP